MSDERRAVGYLIRLDARIFRGQTRLGTREPRRLLRGFFLLGTQRVLQLLVRHLKAKQLLVRLPAGALLRLDGRTLRGGSTLGSDGGACPLGEFLLLALHAV